MSLYIYDIKPDSAYTELYSFIKDEFSSGEIITLQTVLKRYLQHHDSLKSFENWDISKLYDKVITSLSMEGRIHRFPGTLEREYVIDKVVNKTQEKVQEEIEKND